MKRNWGMPVKQNRHALRHAKDEKPLLTLLITATFSVIGAAVAAISFNEARSLVTGLFRGPTLIAAIIASGFGCWAYIWFARARFAAHFSDAGDAFSELLRFYVRASIALFLMLIISRALQSSSATLPGVLILCISGGAAAAAAFQTVLAFVPSYSEADH